MAYAHSTGSDSRHALASDIRQPVKYCAHMFIIPTRRPTADRLRPTSYNRLYQFPTASA